MAANVQLPEQDLFVMLPPVALLRARHTIVTTVSTDDPAIALEEAHRRFDLVAGVLTLALNEPTEPPAAYSVVKLDHTSGSRRLVPYYWARIRVVPPSKATEFNLQALERLAGEETKSMALILKWGQAENSRRLAALDATGRQQALLAYCRIIEEVGVLVLGDVRPAPDEEGRLQSAIDQLKAALSKRSSTEKQMSAVYRANSDLGKIKARFTGIRISLAASHLGLDKATADRAADLWNLRSRGVAHPGQMSIGTDDVDAARRVAWDYCTAYLRARWAASHPIPSLEEIGSEPQGPS